MPSPTQGSEESSCPHCGGAVPPGTRAAPWCCTGCSHAQSLLEGLGLTRYYQLRGEDTCPVGVDISANPQDPPGWLTPLLVMARASGREGRLEFCLDIQGLQCAACIWLVEKLFYRHPGAIHLTVNPGVGRLDFAIQDETFPLMAWLGELEQLGYRTGPARKTPDSAADDLLVRFGVCAAIAMNSMILSVAVYFGLSKETDKTIFELFGWVNLALSVLSLGVGGTVFIKSAALSLRRGILHLDAPIALGIVLAFAGSVLSFLTTPDRTTWFDTLNIFITLMLLGRLLQRRVVARGRSLLLQDDGIEGLFVRRIQDGQLQVIHASALKQGQELLVAPGEVVPVRSLLDEDGGDFALDWINGESEPTPFGRGSSVPAGALNRGGRGRRLTALEDFDSSSLHQLLKPPAEMEAGRGFWHHFSTAYVAAVLLLAGAAPLLWLDQGWEKALTVTVSLLVVTCPCALGLSIPLAHEIAQARMRRLGVFVRRPGFFDRAAQVTKVLFDKTGTLTLSEPVLVSEAPLDSLSEEARCVLWHMCATSNHPRSRAIFHSMAQKSVPFSAEILPEEIPGKGVIFHKDGVEWRLGAADFVVRGAESAGVLFGRDGTTIAEFLFHEALQHDASREVKALEHMGSSVWLISGDHVERVATQAAALGILPGHALGGLSPSEKEAFVRKLDQHDTLMIGDGLNDAPAFAAAYCAGTPAVDRPTLPGRADFFYLGRGVGPIAEMLQLSRQVRGVVMRNLILALSYNVLAVGLALSGHMSPLLAAVLMPASSIAVVLSTVTSLAGRPPQVVGPLNLAEVPA